MNSLFRLYERDGTANAATIFDLIVGSGAEPRQTKALAYVLSRSDALLRRLLKHDDVLRQLGGRLPTFDQYIVDAEMIGQTPQGSVRADIVIRFYRGGVPRFALLLEAKSARTAGAPDDALVAQIRRYLAEADFPTLRGFNVVPVALTRSRRILSDIASVTWNDIRELVHANAGRDALLQEFRRFLETVGGTMHFYEVEVLSVPAGSTSEIVEETFIHACPDTKGFSYKVPLRIAFRQRGGGAMPRLHKVVDIVTFDPRDSVAREAALEASYSTEVRDRLVAYLNARDRGFGWGDSGAPCRFYILDPDEFIDLPHRPRPEKSSQGHMYFRLCDLLDREKERVAPA